MYSQNNEEQIILNHFRDRQGAVLDLGANDGKTFSNSLKVIELGWKADLVEASPETFKRLQELHKDNKDVNCINIAVSNVNGKIKFWESGSLLGSGDKSLVSTVNPKELERWPNIEFTETEVQSVTFKGLMELTKNRKFDLITIDIEGVDFLVLSQMDLKALGCEMLIVENNGKEPLKFINYCKQFGFNSIASNGENLILVSNG